MDGADRWAKDRAGALGLAAWLQDPDRQDPVVVVTLPPNRDRPYFDVQALARDVGRFAEVVVLSTGSPSRAFAAAMPAQCGVFGGAARVYPPTVTWVQRLGSARLFLAHSVADAQDRHRTLVAAVHAATGAALASVSGAGVEALADYSIGDVVPALVTRLAVADMDVVLIPGVTVEVAAVDVTDDPRQAVDELFSLGVVVPVRVMATSPWRLCVVGPEVPVTRPAPPLAIGGEPWIAVRETAEAAPVDPAPLAEPWRVTPAEWERPGRPESIPLPSLQLQATEQSEERAPEGPVLTRVIAERDEARAEARQLKGELRLAEQRRAEIAGEMQRVRASLNDKIARIRELQKQAKSAAGLTEPPRGPDLFVEPEQAFRFDIYLTWSTRVAPQDKDVYPLPDYVVGPGFLPSLATAEGIDRTKILEVVVEVLCGRARESVTHSPRPYRVTSGSQTAQRNRQLDGAAAFRVNLQNNTPAARRLHYWHLPDGRIELWNVAGHDDHDG